MAANVPEDLFIKQFKAPKFVTDMTKFMSILAIQHHSEIMAACGEKPPREAPKKKDDKKDEKKEEKKKEKKDAKSKIPKKFFSYEEYIEHLAKKSTKKEKEEKKDEEKKDRHTLPFSFNKNVKDALRYIISMFVKESKVICEENKNEKISDIAGLSKLFSSEKYQDKYIARFFVQCAFNYNTKFNIPPKLVKLEEEIDSSIKDTIEVESGIRRALGDTILTFLCVVSKCIGNMIYQEKPESVNLNKLLVILGSLWVGIIPNALALTKNVREFCSAMEKYDKENKTEKKDGDKKKRTKKEKSDKPKKSEKKEDDKKPKKEEDKPKKDEEKKPKKEEEKKSEDKKPSKKEEEKKPKKEKKKDESDDEVSIDEEDAKQATYSSGEEDGDDDDE